MRIAPCLVVACGIAFAVIAPVTAFSWTLSPVDQTRNSGWDTSLQLDSSGLPHVAYWTPGVGIQIATFDGSQWSYDLFPGPEARLPDLARAKDGGADGPSPTRSELLITDGVDLALDPSDQPWLAHVRIDCFSGCSGTLRVSHRVGSTWTTEDIGITHSRPSIAVAADGTVHLCYGDASDDLRYVTRSPAGQWGTSELVGVDGVGGILRIDASGVPHVAWTVAGRIWYATRENGTWDGMAVDTIGSYGGLALAVTPSGEARIAFQVKNWPLAGLWYLEQVGATWNRQQVLVGDGAGVSPAIDLDPAGDPFLAFNNQSGLDLEFATRKQGIWNVGPIDTEGNTGYNASIAFDHLDRPLIAYQADVSVGTRLATGDMVLDVRPGAAPSRFALRSAGPNPARVGAPLTLILDSPFATDVRLELLDVAGRRVASRPAVRANAGSTRIDWDATLPGPGMYVLRARAAAGASSTRIAVIR